MCIYGWVCEWVPSGHTLAEGKLWSAKRLDVEPIYELHYVLRLVYSTLWLLMLGLSQGHRKGRNGRLIRLMFTQWHSERIRFLPSWVCQVHVANVRAWQLFSIFVVLNYTGINTIRVVNASHINHDLWLTSSQLSFSCELNARTSQIFVHRTKCHIFVIH